mmetsp:Transcript_42910/g.68930  ORF Transcript_42910/g.68930 Transcript_42910/m.68930 type:complete len:100 (-) Transcript_42910:149-448(-)
MNDLSCSQLHPGQDLILVDQLVEGTGSRKYNVGWYSLVEGEHIDEVVHVVCESTDIFGVRVRVAGGVGCQSFGKSGLIVHGEQSYLNISMIWLNGWKQR